MSIFHQFIVSSKLSIPLSMNFNSAWNSCGGRFGVGKGNLSSVVDREELSFFKDFSGGRRNDEFCSTVVNKTSF